MTRKRHYLFWFLPILLFFSLIFPVKTKAAIDMINLAEVDRSVSLSGTVNFSFTMLDNSGVACPTCTYTASTSPAETVSTSKIGNQVSGSFSPSRPGTYSLIISVTDGSANTQQKNYLFFVNAASTTLRTYFHGKPAINIEASVNLLSKNSDTGSLLLTPPYFIETRTCSQWVQASIDQLPDNFPYAGLLDGVDISMNTSVYLPFSLGVERRGTYDMVVDYSRSLPASPNGARLATSSFSNLNWTMGSSNDWYQLTVKNLNAPFYISGSGWESYTDLFYYYTASPLLSSNKDTNYNIALLSATAASGDSASLQIALQGTSSAMTTSFNVASTTRPFLSSLNTIYSDGHLVLTTRVASSSISVLDNIPLEISPSSASVDVRVGDWTAGYKQWSEMATSSSITVSHTVSGLTPSANYLVRIDNGTPASYISDSEGSLDFTYSGGYTSSHVFELYPDSGSPTYPVKYWYKAGADANWSTLTSNWWDDLSHSVQSSALPSASSTVVIISTTSPLADLDSWIAPVNIVASSSPMSFKSLYFNSPGVISTGNASFASSSVNRGIVKGDATFSDSSYNNGRVTGSAKFLFASGGVATLSSGIRWGNGTASSSIGSDDAAIGSWVFNGTATNYGVIGTATFNASSTNYGTVSTATFNATSSNAGLVDAANFNNSSYNRHFVNNANFSNTSLNQGEVSSSGNFYNSSASASPVNNGFFYDSSINYSSVHDLVLNGSSSSGGQAYDAALYDSSFIGGVVYHNATLNDTSASASRISGVAKFNYAIGGVMNISDGMRWGNGSAGSIVGSDDLPVTRWIFTGTGSNEGGLEEAFFYNDSSNANSFFEAPVGSAVYYNNSANAGSNLYAIFNDSSYNNNFGFDLNSAIFNDDLTENMGSVIGEKIRHYQNDGSPTRDFTADGPWTIVADGLAVDLSGATTDGSTVYKTVNGGSFTPSVSSTPVTLPLVTTGTTTSLTYNSARFIADITDLGNAPSTQHGFIYGTDPSLLGATTVTMGWATTTGEFTKDLSGLSSETTYYVQGYAVNFAGTSTGLVASFRTTAAPNDHKDITSFGFPQGAGRIDGTNINVTVPYGTNLTNLVASFVSTGATVAVGGTPQVSGVTINDFTNPVTYVVTATDSSTKSYIVTVSSGTLTTYSSNNSGGSGGSGSAPLCSINPQALGCPGVKTVEPSVENIVLPPVLPVFPGKTGSSGSSQKVLKLGMIDPEVKVLQIFLNSNPATRLTGRGVGAPGRETNYFGILTKQALIKFQKINRLKADGIFDQNDREMMIKLKKQKK